MFLELICHLKVHLKTIMKLKICLDEQLDNTALLQYLQRKFQTASNDLTVLKFGYGQSNPSYYVRFDGKEMVLRKKPVSFE